MKATLLIELPQTGKRRIQMHAMGFGRLWCAACERRVSIVTLEQAAVLSNVPVETLAARIRERRLHVRKRLSGSFLVCLESLIGFMRASSEEFSKQS